MESFTYDDIYRMAEKRYPCPNSLLSTVAFTKAKIDAFIEGFQEAVNYLQMNSVACKSESNYRCGDSDWAAYYPY